MNRPRLVSPATDPLAEQTAAALDILTACAEVARLLALGAAELDQIGPYNRARMQHASVAFSAFAEDLQRRLT